MGEYGFYFQFMESVRKLSVWRLEDSVSSGETQQQKMVFVVSLPMSLPHVASFHCDCLLLPRWQEGDYHDFCTAAPNYPPKIFPTFIFKPYVWSNRNTLTGRMLAQIVAFAHTHGVKSIDSSANRWSSGTERESWKQSKHFLWVILGHPDCNFLLTF